MSLAPEQTLTLDSDTIALLFELLGRWVEGGKLEALKPNLEHEAEAWALNDLFCVLETVIDPSVAGGFVGARTRLMAFHGNFDYPA